MQQFSLFDWVMKSGGDFNMSKGFVRDVNYNELTDRMQRLKGESTGNMASTNLTKATRNRILAANPNISSKPNSYANAASGASVAINKHDATCIKPPIKLNKHVVILGVSIASKEELIGLVDKIEFVALDDLISGITTAESQAAYALVLELARGFDYVNSNSDTSSLEDVLENETWMIRNSPIILKKWSMNTCLCKKELTRIPVWVKIHDVPIQVFSEDGLSIIASQIGKPIMLDSYTSSMCIESWGRSSFTRCLIEINADDVLKESLTMGVPFIKGLRYKPKATANVPNKGANDVGNASKSGLSQVSSLLKNQPLKAIVPPNKKGNITISNSYAALNDESEEEVENV
ncbi:zinc knuckle CX2CX4HX4C containing protein [Tanacetum coccineum]